MKILKKFLSVFLISFVFVVSVKADVETYDLDSTEWFGALNKFKEKYPNWTGEKIESICDDLVLEYVTNQYYICNFTLRGGTGGYFASKGLYYNNRYWVPEFNISIYSSDVQLNPRFQSDVRYLWFESDNYLSTAEFRYDYDFNLLYSGNTSRQFDWFFDFNYFTGGWNSYMGIVKSNLSNQNYHFTNANFNVNNNYFGYDYGDLSFRDMLNIRFDNYFLNDYRPQMYSLGNYDIGLEDIYLNINKNEFLNNNSNKKGRIEFATLEYVENFDLLENFPLYSDTEGIDVIVDTNNSYCELSDGNTMRCVYDYKINGSFDGDGYFSLKMHNKNKNIFKNTLFLSSVKDTKISSFISDEKFCTNYDNDYKRISTITNPKSVSFIREGNVRFPTDITKDSETLRGVFSFTWNEDFNYTEEDFNVTFVNNSKSNLIGNYDFKCVGNSCFIDYSYASASSKLEYANIKFIVTMPSEETKLIPKLNVNHCPDNSVVSITYDTNSTIDTIDSIIKKTFEDTGLDLSGLLNMPDLIDRGPIDSILTLPLNVLQTLTNTLSGSVCTPLTIKLPFVNKNMSIPCINTIYEEINATTFFERVGSIASTIILINYFIFLYSWFERVIRMEPMNIECWGFDNV